MTHSIRVSVVIPTYRRPDGLARAIQSVLQQADIDDRSVELLVVDNDPDGSGQKALERFPDPRIPIRYIHEPSPGVANARNAAIANIRSQLVAFLDDDQSAPGHWLARLLSTYDACQAAVVFGPVVTELPDSSLKHEAYLKAFFARTGPDESGLIDDFFGCGNSLLDMAQMPQDGPLFDIKANETGGEDDFLFSRLQDSGRTFGWAADAEVFEHVPLNRATLSYTLRRTFAYGQAPTTICAMKSPPDIPGIVFWTLVGLGQTLVFGLMSAAMGVLRMDRRAFWYDKTAQGLGKMLWFGPFEQRFYGRHAS